MEVGGQRKTDHFTSGKQTRTRCVGGWVRPWAGLKGCGKCRPNRDSFPGPSRP